MTWTYQDIEREWLSGSVVQIPPEEIVAAFERCETHLGNDWISLTRPPGLAGASPTLTVVAMGQRLASVEGVAGAEKLIERIRQGDASAGAELHALHLLNSGGPSQVELFPDVTIGNRTRQPDFRIRRGDDPWTYVEVSRTAVSQAQERMLAVLDKLAAIIDLVEKPFDLEVFLRREPTSAEVDTVLRVSVALCNGPSVAREELPDGLGLLLLGEAPSGPVVIDDHGERPVARLSSAKWRMECTA